MQQNKRYNYDKRYNKYYNLLLVLCMAMILAGMFVKNQQAFNVITYIAVPLEIIVVLRLIIALKRMFKS